MKKILLVLFVLTCLAVVLNAQTLLQESFADSPLDRGWTLLSGQLNVALATPAPYDITSRGNWWFIGNFAHDATLGTGIARAKIGSAGHVWLVSPQITIPASGKVTLTFDLAITAAQSTGNAPAINVNDQFVVFLSTAGAGPNDWGAGDREELRRWNIQGFYNDDIIQYNTLTNGKNPVTIEFDAVAGPIWLAFYSTRVGGMPPPPNHISYR